MGISWIRFITSGLFFASIIVLSFQELIVLRHPPSKDTRTRDITCIAEDDDSALIWNYDPGVVNDGNSFTAFQRKVGSERNCAVWDSTAKCIARWSGMDKWSFVNSSNEPMGPALDYRWEGFDEHVFPKSTTGPDYQHVGEVGGSANTVVFSARGSKDVRIFLCEERQPTKGPCLWISIGSLNGGGFLIRSCAYKAPEPHSSSVEQRATCIDVTDSKHEPKVIGPYEWRTFRIEWNGVENTVRVFENNENEPFMWGKVDKWHSVSHIFVKDDTSARLKFHFYGYYRAEERNAELITEEYKRYDQNFCLKVLVGLCRECKLDVALVDKNRRRIELESTFMGEQSQNDDLLIWRSVKLQRNYVPPADELRLQIKAVLNQGARNGRWAIDSFRTCQPVDGIRQSTIAVRYNPSTNSAVGSGVYCQKLSYGQSTLVHSIPANVIGKNTDQLHQKLVRRWESSCTSSCGKFGEHWSICDSIGCTCGQGYSGPDCNGESKTGHFGNNRIDKCEFCSESCDTRTGYCLAKCKDEYLLPPLCRTKLEKPRVDRITDTTLSIYQRVGFEAGVEAALHFYIENPKNAERLPAYPARPEASMHELNITSLEPDTEYNVYAVAAVYIEGNGVAVRSPGTSFKTVVKALPDIQGLQINSLSNTTVELEWKRLPPISGVFPSYNVSIKLVKLFGCEDLGKGTPPQKDIVEYVKYPNASISGLRPYARYTATVTATLNDRFGRSGTIVFETHESSVPTSKVNNLMLDEENNRLVWNQPKDCTTISGPTKATKLFFYTRVGDSKWSSPVVKETSDRHYSLKELGVKHYTKYKVYVHVIRDFGKPVNLDINQQLRWPTPPAAPPAVEDLEIYEPDPEKNTISVRWKPPNPPNGEIESYLVVVLDGTQESSSKPIRVSELPKDDQRTSYISSRNLPLPQNIGANKITIQVRAKNKDVRDYGPPSTVSLDPNFYSSAPTKPQNLTAIPEAHGIVNLKWSELAIPVKKDIRFRISVGLLETKLRKLPEREFPIITEYLPSSDDHQQKSHATKLYLWPSTSYEISVTAVNTKNASSPQAQVKISLDGDADFAKKDKLQITQNGTLINLKIPKVVNATKGTMVNVLVKGAATCMEMKSTSSLPLLLETEWVAFSYKPKEAQPKRVMIDAEHIHGANSTSKCSLDPGAAYKIRIVIADSSSSNVSVRLETSITLTDNEQQSLAWLIIFPIIAICLLMIFYFWRRKRVAPPAQPEYAEILPVSQRRVKKENPKDFSKRDESIASSVNNADGERESNPVYAVPFHSDPKSNLVSMVCFEEYAKEAVSSGVLETQYAMFPRGLTKPCNYGRLPQNMPKNRNKNLIAYDETRIILDKIPGDPYSDYINANYIQGYGEENAYIATQGPMPNTVNDFWRMIHQKGVRVICMLTNLIENGKKMCEQYWPEIGTTAKYGSITVSNTDRQVFADYTFRTFKLSYKRETRTVMHLHYTGWPAQGVPTYSQSLVSYLKRLVEILDGHGPVVIHCSDGDGRTGTIILCDMCVRQGIVEREIDVPAVTKRMYNSRANMLDNPQQYLLAHVVIADSIMSIPTQIPCNDVLPRRIKALRKLLPSHIQRLNNTVWQERALHSFARPESQVSLHYASSKLPEVVLSASREEVRYQRNPSFNEESNYIKAVDVDGVRIKTQYLAAQLPPASGLPDLWRFVAERNIELIIILQSPKPNDPLVCDFMPGESILVPVGYIQIEAKASQREEGLFQIDKLMLTDRSEEKVRSQPVTAITCSGWEYGDDGKPPATNALVSLWRASEKIQRKESPTLVLCRDGVTACGLYLALSFLLEKMAVERECDVISAVRAVRRSRPEFVQSMDEFQYLYDAAVDFVDCFQTYANFS